MPEWHTPLASQHPEGQVSLEHVWQTPSTQAYDAYEPKATHWVQARPGFAHIDAEFMDTQEPLLQQPVGHVTGLQLRAVASHVMSAGSATQVAPFLPHAA